jgi:hypothetical protein
MESIVESWEDFLSGISDDSVSEQNLGYRMVLRRAHEEYRRCFEDQEKLRENESFIQAVAAAFARMPFAKRLEFHDSDYRSWRRYRSYIDQTSDNDALRQNLVYPVGWEEARLHQLGPPPMEVLVKLPGAIHKAGGFLTGLEIDVPPLEQYAPLALNDEDVKNLTAVVQKMKLFHFRPSSARHPDLWPPPEPGQVKDLVMFLSALLDTESIEDMNLDLDFLWNIDHPPSFSLGSILTFRPWRNLSSISCSGVPLHLSELEQFVQHLVLPVGFMSLRSIRLLSGSWAEALDILREKTVDYLSFGSPSGAECEAMSGKKKKEIFASIVTKSYHGGRPGSPAELYVRGMIDSNPLRDGTGDGDDDDDPET